MLKVFDVVCVKCGKEIIDFMFEGDEEMPKCECGGDLEKIFGNFTVHYKLLYDPRKDKVPGVVSSKGNFERSATPLKVFWPWVTRL